MSRSLVDALRTVRDRLANGAPYQWGHMGQCNCGHLAQVVCQRSAKDIHASAIARATGEWSEHAFAYCADSGALIDDIVADLLAVGLTREDILHLEHLDDPRVIARVGRTLQKNQREDAIAYFASFADLVEESLAPLLTLTTTTKAPTTKAPTTKAA